MDNKEGQDAATIEDLKDERVPSCLTWSYEEVADWIEELGFPYYRVGEAFFHSSQTVAMTTRDVNK